jgi:hypothetical protein
MPSGTITKVLMKNTTQLVALAGEKPELIHVQWIQNQGTIRIDKIGQTLSNNTLGLMN